MGMIGATLIRAARRFISSLPALFGVLVFTFLLMRVLPGDPAVFFASGPSAGQAEIAELRHKMGLDQPMPVQLAHYLADIATGNLGRSLTTGQPVTADMRQRLPASLELTFRALDVRGKLSVTSEDFALGPNGLFTANIITESQAGNADGQGELQSISLAAIDDARSP